MTSGERLHLIAEISELFSPSAPIERHQLLSGRERQVQRVFESIATRGQHVVIFGERGVGKTSLANAVDDLLATGSVDRRRLVAKVNCSEDDSFASLWRKVFARIRFQVDTGEQTIGFRGTPVIEIRSAADSLRDNDNPSPYDIARVLESIGESVIILDEFDRYGDTSGRMSDLIKMLSDESVRCTLILVGVAQTIDDLLREHASIARAINQISMPRMSYHELEQIIDKAVDGLTFSIDPNAKSRIVLLSLGLPHYTHVLGKASTLHALEHRRTTITVDDVTQGIQAAVQEGQQSIRQAYQTATASPRKDTLFKQVLLACALAPVDELGTFASSEVREPLRLITGKPYEIPGYSQHLDKFSSPDRGSVLTRIGTARRFRFRFTDPLLQPFVLMRGLADGLISQDQLQSLQNGSA